MTLAGYILPKDVRTSKERQHYAMLAASAARDRCLALLRKLNASDLDMLLLHQKAHQQELPAFDLRRLPVRVDVRTTVQSNLSPSP